MHHTARTGFVLLCLIALAGCRTWQPVDTSQGLAIAEARPEAVRVLRADGTRFTLSRPLVRADSIVGYDGFDPVAAALSDVQSVELQRWSAPRTAGFLVVQASLVLHVFALIVQAQPHYRGLF